MKANDKRGETTLANDDGRLKFLESCGDGRRSSNESSCSTARVPLREQRHNYRRIQRGGAASASAATSTPEYRTRNRASSLLYRILSLLIRFVLIVSHRCADLPLFTLNGFFAFATMSRRRTTTRISLLSYFCIHR